MKSINPKRMKSVKQILLWLGLLFYPTLLIAQISIFSSYPSGYLLREEVEQLYPFTLNAPPPARIDSMITGKNPRAGELYVIGLNQPVSLNMDNSGEWYHRNGFKTWRLKIHAPGAQGLALLYSRFDIPASASVFVYRPDGKHKSRAYKSWDNPGKAHFSTEVITGETIILEYFAPATEKRKPNIEIEAITYIFREGHSFIPKDASDNGASDPCQVNVNCSEGNNWQNQKRGVAKILVIEGGMAGLCSGSLVNNTQEDCKNYFLTAQHCGAAATSNNMNQWQFYFNFEAPGCSNISNAQANQVDNEVVVGCSKIAASGSSSNVSASDFLLLEFNSSIPSSFNPYYNGWDRNTTAPSSGVGIHHPSGDIKKISTYTSSPVSDAWNPTPQNTHWRVTWTGTANGHGVTEGGSSGSPLFNQNGRIVGVLSGGSSYCNSVQPGGQNAPDLYGKMSYSWESVASANNRKLRPWLDPAGNNPSTLNGRNACSGNPPTPGGCDTVGNFQLGVHTPTNLPTQSGWVAGNNEYGDLAKAEKFKQSDFPAGYQLTGMIYFFAHATGNGNVALNVWAADGPGGAPGTVIAQASASISQLPTGGTALLVTLNTPITITSDFYIGVVLPTSAGSSVSLYTTAADEPSVNTAWEQYNDGIWHTYEDGWSFKIAHAIFAIGCSQSSSGQAPVANFSGTPLSLPAGNTVTFTDLSTNSPTSWSWNITPFSGTQYSYQNGTSSNSQNPVVLFNTPGVYTVSLTASNATGSDSETKNNYITVTSSTGIQNADNESLMLVYPNPAKHTLFISFNTSLPENSLIRISDVTGRTLTERSLTPGNLQQEVPVMDLPEGVYLLSIITPDQTWTQRFVKQ